MRWLFTSLIKAYQRWLSPLLPASCRYYPTCSHYAVTAIERFGVIRGTIMGAARIVRCNPFVQGGIDYVPDHFSLRRNRQRPA